MENGHFGFGLLINTVVVVVTDATVPADLGRQFLVSFVALLLILPVFSTLFMILQGNRPRQQVLHVVAGGLAIIPGMWMFLSTSASALPPIQLWGLWLYVGLVLAGLILEAVTLITKKSYSQ